VPTSPGGLVAVLSEAGSAPPALPTWVTRQVEQSGTGLGLPVTTGPIEIDELLLARRLGAGSTRRSLVEHLLAPPGVELMAAALADGTYTVAAPEDAALLTVAWLETRGDHVAARDLVRTLAPHVGSVRLAPRLTSTRVVPAGHAYLWTAARAMDALSNRRVSRRIEAQREALTVWNPFTDRLVELWLSAPASDAGGPRITEAWRRRARDLLTEYEELAASHTVCGRHRRHGSGLGMLLARTRSAAEPESSVTEAQAHRLARALTAIVARRGRPGSPQLTRLRDEELRTAARTEFAGLARIAAKRFAPYPEHEGVVDVAPLLAPVTAAESLRTGIIEDTPMPPVVRRIIGRTAARPAHDLLADGVVTSVDQLAELIPHLAAPTVVGGSDVDPSLVTLVAATHRAHQRHTAPLMRSLGERSGFADLPWVRAVGTHSSMPPPERARELARQIGVLTLDHASSNPMPHGLVRELRRVLAGSGTPEPLDTLDPVHFAGRFPDAHRRAAQAAGQLLADTIYPAYFDIDPDVVARLCRDRLIPGRRPWERRGRRTLSVLCAERSDVGLTGQSVEVNRSVIEQGRILVADDLAFLVGLGVVPTDGWTGAGRRAFEDVCLLLECAHRGGGNRLVRRSAAAWRRVVAYVALASADEQVEFVEWAHKAAADRRPDVAERLGHVVTGLEHVVRGGRFDADGRCPGGRRFIGASRVHHCAGPLGLSD
jgi:hypothetical protein